MRRSLIVKYLGFVMMLVALVRAFFGITMFNFFITALTFGAVDRKGTQLKIAIAAIIVILLSALADLICGFTGALHWEEPLRAKNLVIWGSAAVLLGLAGNLLQAASGYGISYVAWLTGLVFPLLFLAAAVCFLVGAGKRKQS